MKKITINSIEYIVKDNGVMIPADLIRETGARVSSPGAIAVASEDIAHEQQEHFVIFTLDGSNEIINRYIVTKGLVNQSQIHPREAFRPAILDNAVSIVAMHNHPSGSLSASSADITATQRLREAGKLLGIPVIDHIIVSKEGYTSIRETNPELF